MDSSHNAAVERMFDAAAESGQDTVPAHTLEGLRMYVVEHIKPGGFLQAVLCNDLTGAVVRADEDNARALSDIIRFLWNALPATAWGSRAKMNAWLHQPEPPATTETLPGVEE